MKEVKISNHRDAQTGNRIMCFFGPDGSGKTSLSWLLRVYLASKGGNVGYHWFRGSHLLVSVLARFLRYFVIFRGLDNPYYGIKIPDSIRTLWGVLEFCCFLPLYLFRRLFSQVYDVLVCDRCVLDFVVWVVVTLRYPGFVSTVPGRFLLALSGAEFSLYLYVPLWVLAGRSDVGLDFLAREYAVYSVLTRYFQPRCIVDTGSKRPVESLVEVLACLRRAGRLN